MQRKFKRKKQKVATIILSVLLLIIIAVLLTCDFKPNIIIGLILLMFILATIIRIVIAYCPVDFDCTIKVGEEMLEFELNKKNHTPIRKNFTILRTTWWGLVLTDGMTIMSIPYNQAVLDFLIEVRES